MVTRGSVWISKTNRKTGETSTTAFYISSDAAEHHAAGRIFRVVTRTATSALDFMRRANNMFVGFSKSNPNWIQRFGSYNEFDDFRGSAFEEYRWHVDLDKKVATTVDFHFDERTVKERGRSGNIIQELLR